MSLQLLHGLNGNNNGALLEFLNSFDHNNKELNIAWYPSAGEDFRDLLYLSKAYYQKNHLEIIKFGAPHFFIHTDYFDGRFFHKKIGEIVYYDYSRTTITITHREELPPLHLTLDDKIIDFPDGCRATHKVIFTILSIDSHKLGKWEVPLIYIFSENAAFISEFALRKVSKFTHVVNVRFGGSLGGGRSSGIWIKNVLKRIGCKLLLTDNHYFVQDGDLRIYELFPILKQKDEYTLETIRITPKNSWPGYNDVSWQLIK